MGYNHVRECELAFSRNELKEYLEGVGKYQEPPDRYSDTPTLDVSTRNNCINILFGQENNSEYIEKYMEAILSLANGKVSQLKIAMRYIMAQLQLESIQRASFQLNDKEFYEQLKRIIIAKEQEIKNNHDAELENMWQVLDVQDKYISSKTGYNIK